LIIVGDGWSGCLSLSGCLEMGPRPRCLICLSRRWRKDPTSGLIVCSEGHVFEVRPCSHFDAHYINEAQNYRNETIERDEPLGHALKKRAIKARKTVDGGPGNVNTSRQLNVSFSARAGWIELASPDYYGERAEFHYLTCLQVLLRKQVAALTKLWSLPPEFEAISRDVWSLTLTSKGEVPHIDSGIDEHKRSEQAGAASSDEDDEEGDNSDSESSESENGDTGVTNLLDRLSEDDDSDTEQPTNEPQLVMQLRGKGFVSKFPYYINVAVLLVSCWILRLPVISSDILKWVSRKE